MVDLQIHGVSEPTRRTLSAEAKARGESLQEYLLDLLDREAHEIEAQPANPKAESAGNRHELLSVSRYLSAFSPVTPTVRSLCD